MRFTFRLSHVFSKATVPATQAGPNTPSMTISAIFQFPENLPLTLVVAVMIVVVVEVVVPVVRLAAMVVVTVVWIVLAIVVNMSVVL